MSTDVTRSFTIPAPTFLALPSICSIPTDPGSGRHSRVVFDVVCGYHVATLSMPALSTG